MAKIRSTPTGHNAEEIARLRRWRLRASLLFFCCIAEMPLTCVGSGVAVGIINSQRLGLDYAQIAMLCAILLPLFGLGGMLLTLFDRKHAGRCLALAQLADDLGLRYTYRPAPDEIDILTACPFINLERVMQGGTGLNLLTGTFKKHVLITVDFNYNHYYGNRVRNTRQTMAVFPECCPALPDFAVVQKGLGEKVEQFIGGLPIGKKIKVRDEAKFNDRFLVAGVERDAVLGCLSEAVIDLMMQEGNLTFLIHEGTLMVARQGAILAAHDYADFLQIAIRLARDLARTAE